MMKKDKQMIKERSEQEWEEFFESDDFDYTAFVPTKAEIQNRNKKLADSKLNEAEEKEKDNLIDEIFNNLK